MTKLESSHQKRANTNVTREHFCIAFVSGGLSSLKSAESPPCNRHFSIHLFQLFTFSLWENNNGKKTLPKIGNDLGFHESPGGRGANCMSESLGHEWSLGSFFPTVSFSGGLKDRQFFVILGRKLMKIKNPGKILQIHRERKSTFTHSVLSLQ